MERKVDLNLMDIKKAVHEALKLDGEQQFKMAYVHYLECIQTIISCLLDDAKDIGIDITKNTQKCITLGLNCMERLSLLIEPLSKMPQANNTTTKPPPLSLVPQGLDILSSLDNSEICSSSFQRGSQSLGQYVPPLTPTSQVLHSPTERFSLPPPGAPHAGGHTAALLSSPTSPPPTHSNVPLASLPEPSPLELAQKQNEKLLHAYQARLNRSRQSSAGKQQVTNLSLTLQRRLAENLAIAQAREQTLVRKLNERHQRLQQDAVRRFSSAHSMSKEEVERHHMYTQILAYEKAQKTLVAWRQRIEQKPDDANSIIMLVKIILSLPDHPLTQLLFRYRHAVYEKLKPLTEKYVVMVNDSTTANKNEETETNDKISNDLPGDNCAEEKTDSSSPKDGKLDVHDTDQFDDLYDEKSDTEDGQTTSQDPSEESSQSPHTEYVTKEGCEKLNALSPDSEYETITQDEISKLEIEALERHLSNIVADVHDYLEKILAMFVVSYEGLGSATGRDACYAQIEEPFFKPIWGYLLALFRIVHQHDERTLQQALERFAGCTPARLKINEKYQLVSDLVPTHHAFPYQRPVLELQALTNLSSPLTKLECIVQVSRLICSSVEEHYTSIGETDIPKLGADDLLPLLSFVVVRCGSSQLLAECRALEEFIHEGYLIGEEGYCLTLLQTALAYVLTLATHSPTP